MKIAIHAADLDHQRIDGTRIYILNMLKHFGEIDRESEFLIYHKKSFNPKLIPKSFPNYIFKKKSFPLHWTQTRFAGQLLVDRPDRLWMPMHCLPSVRFKRLKTIVTIHDLAFKIFPQHFLRKDLYKINLLTDYVVKHADHLIAVSHASKKDLLRFYPNLAEKKVSVVHHGFDASVFSQSSDEMIDGVTLQSLTLEKKNYLLYTGAIQPRKDIITLVKAFENLKRSHKSLKLVIAGKRAWLHQETVQYIESSKCYKDIIMTGPIDFEPLAVLFRNAAVFVYPSLYEGFGIPILEAFASGVPVVCSDNSSLREVGGDAALYFTTGNVDALCETIDHLLLDEQRQFAMGRVGVERIKEFTWIRSATKTLDIVKTT